MGQRLGEQEPAFRLSYLWFHDARPEGTFGPSALDELWYLTY